MIAELAVVTEQLAAMTEERDHYKRELGLMHEQETFARVKIRLGLTRRETALILTLYARRGRAVSTPALLEAVYAGRDEPEAKIMNVFVCKVRGKLGDGIIETVFGHGYQLTEAGVAVVEQALMVAQ